MVKPGKRKPRRGKERIFSNPEEIEKQLNKLNVSDDSDEDEEKSGEESDSDEEESSSSSDGDTSDSEEDDSSEESSDSDDDDDGAKKKKKKSPPKPKGVQGLIEIENPNRVAKPKPSEDNTGPVQLSRREREELEKQRSRERYNKLHAEGRTDEAKADMERLAIIRKEREQAAARREEERLAKEAEAKAKRVLLDKALSKKGNVAK